MIFVVKEFGLRKRHGYTVQLMEDSGVQPFTADAFESFLHRRIFPVLARAGIRVRRQAEMLGLGQRLLGEQVMCDDNGANV
jgi:hypothetical protein